MPTAPITWPLQAPSLCLLGLSLHSTSARVGADSRPCDDDGILLHTMSYVVDGEQCFIDA